LVKRKKETGIFNNPDCVLRHQLDHNKKPEQLYLLKTISKILKKKSRGEQLLSSGFVKCYQDW
jgi:hypothetical protein